MTITRKCDLNPVVIGVKTECGSRYCQCKVIVTLEVDNDKGKREELVVAYPTQGEKHLVYLIKDVETGQHFSHSRMNEIAEAIHKTL